MDSEQKKHIHKILFFLKRIQNNKFPPQDIERLFLALLSATEIETISQRFDILQLLLQEAPQREISEKLKVGIATVTRGNKAFKENKELLAKILNPVSEHNE